MLFALAIVILGIDEALSNAWSCDDDDCKAMSAGPDGKSCMFSTPVKVCLKNKSWRPLSKSDDGTSAQLITREWPYMGIGCWEGQGKRRANSQSEDYLKKDFKGKGYTDQDNSNKLSCLVYGKPCPAKDDTCQSTPLGTDGNSCQFDKPVRMCLKDKAWRLVTARDGKWALRKQNAVACRSGNGVARFDDSKENLAKNFAADGYNSDEDKSAIVETCEPRSAETAFSMDASNACSSLDKLLAYLRDQATPEILQKVSEVVSKASSKH